MMTRSRDARLMKQLKGRGLAHYLQCAPTAMLIEEVSASSAFSYDTIYTLEELVTRAAREPEIIEELAHILAIHTEFVDPRKPMPSYAALNRLFREGPVELERRLIQLATGWSDRKKLDLIHFGLMDGNRDKKLHAWMADYGFEAPENAAQIDDMLRQ